MTIHGLTRSREIADLIHKMGLGVSYQDILNLYSTWAKHDIEKNTICPDQLVLGFPGTAIMDNDDFHEDTLTGATCISVSTYGG